MCCGVLSECGGERRARVAEVETVGGSGPCSSFIRKARGESCGSWRKTEELTMGGSCDLWRNAKWRSFGLWRKARGRSCGLWRKARGRSCGLCIYLWGGVSRVQCIEACLVQVS